MDAAIYICSAKHIYIYKIANFDGCVTRLRKNQLHYEKGLFQAATIL